VVSVISRLTTTILAGVVTAIWAANIMADIFSSGYEASDQVNGIFMAVVGGLIAASRTTGGGKGGGDKHE
jgi:hypothetical protein